MRRLRILLIVLIVVCLGATAIFSLQKKSIVTVDGKGVSEDASRVTGQLQLLKEELADLQSMVQEQEAAKSALERQRYLEISLPGAFRQEQNLLYYHPGDRKLYYVEPAVESCRVVYSVKEPWYLMDYDLSVSGQAVWAQKWNSAYKSEQEIGIYVQDLPGGGTVREVDRIRPPYWLEDEDDIRVEMLAFSPDGDYIIVQLAGAEWQYFNVYTAKQPGRAITQAGYDEMSGAYTQREFISFVANSSAVLYAEPAETTEFAGQTLLYEESLYYNEQGFFRLKDLAGETFFTANGRIYVLGKKADNEDIWIEALPEVDGGLESSYLYQVRNARFNSLLPEPSGQGVEEPGKVIEVKSVEELLKAISPNRTIKLLPGSYNLTSAPQVENPYVKYVPVDNRFEIVICNVDELTLMATGDGPAEILAEPTYANVLGFEDCSKISISGIRAGHVYEGYCTGGVLQFSDCTDILITNSLFYGSGTYGLTLQNVSGLQVINSVITECTYGIMDVYQSTELMFISCRFIRNRDMDMINLSDSSQATFEECEFSENQSTGRLFAIEEGSRAIVQYSQILNNNAVYLAISENGLELSQSELRGNSFTTKYEQ